VSGKTAGGRWAKEAESRERVTGGLNLGRKLWVQHFNDKGHMVSSSFAFAWSRVWKD
jgi:hypothetical protein